LQKETDIKPLANGVDAKRLCYTLALSNWQQIGYKQTVGREGWRLTEGIMMLMRDEARSKRAAFAVVTLSQRHSGLSYRRGPWFHTTLVSDKRIKALDERENFPVINLAPILFRSCGRAERTSLDGIWPKVREWATGTQRDPAAGEAISSWLCPLVGSTPASRWKFQHP